MALVAEIMKAVLSGSTPEDCPSWPPDVFAVAASLLQRSGTYTFPVRLGSGHDPATWSADVDQVASDWIEAIELQRTVPPAVSERWSELLAGGTTNIHEVSDQLARCLVYLLAVSDSASVSCGIRDPSTDEFHRLTMRHLARNVYLSVCSETVDVGVARVLPKQHTPRRGASLRSLSHHLALMPQGGIEAQWLPPVPGDQHEPFNLLILPWPDTFDAAWVHPVSRNDLVPGFQYFDYRPMEIPGFMNRLKTVLAAARSAAGSVHAVVLPELAISDKQFNEAAEYLEEQRVGLISGVHGSEASGRPQNLCRVNVRGLHTTTREHHGIFDQPKHHRWCLDASQINGFRLSHRLDPRIEWWEHTDVVTRRVHFFTLQNTLTVCALICEDLARQDPAVEVIRAVGPHLLIALLLDAPQAAGAVRELILSSQ